MSKLWDRLPVVVPVPDTGQYELYAPWRFYWAERNFDLLAGFRFEASIPAIAWQLTTTPFDPRVLPGACGHDALYRATVDRQGLDQKTADEFIRAACLECGLPDRKARRIYWALRALGRSSWTNYTSAPLDNRD